MPTISRISFLVVTVAAGALGAATVVAPFARAYGSPPDAGTSPLAVACPSAATDATASAVLPPTR
jgi:hypothetical protein